MMDNWLTEKIIDCMLTGTVPIYWGAPNIHEVRRVIRRTLVHPLTTRLLPPSYYHPLISTLLPPSCHPPIIFYILPH
jgi:hypothetical protein